VLVVEDDVDIRETVHLLLEDAYYVVLEATDGVVGLAHLRGSARPLVVLVDYMMPHLNALDLLRAVAHDEELFRRHIYLLVTANYDWLPPDGADLLDTLAVATLRKSFDIDMLLGVVARACERLRTLSGADAMRDATDSTACPN
jgi:CheY-like chemotaxis protein